MADAWVTPTAIHSDCGHSGDSVSSLLIDNDLGTYWQHDGAEEHWVIFDMGETYTVKKVRCYHLGYVHWVELGEIYVSDNPEDWGESLGASTGNWYTDATGWEEIDITDKDGRYIKIVGNELDRMGFYEFDIYGDVAGVGGYTLEIGSGSFVETGQTVNLLKDSKIGISAGSFVETGQTVNLLKGYALDIGSGSFIETGQTVGLLKANKLGIGAGSFVWTGSAVTLTRGGRILSIGAGTFVVTGSSVILEHKDGIYTIIPKPHTVYTEIPKPKTEYTEIEKPSTSYEEIRKPKTSHTELEKPTTEYTEE